ALVKLFSELAASQNLTLDDPWPYIAYEATAAGPTQIGVNLSFYTSAVGDHGEFTNIHESELTIGHIFRAAFPNMADNYYRCARRLSPAQEWNRLVFSGGLAQKIDILRQLICEEFGKDYRMSPWAEDTMLGLMALGLAFTRRTSTVAEAANLLFDLK